MPTGDMIYVALGIVYKPGKAKINDSVCSTVSDLLGAYNYCCVNAFNIKGVPVTSLLLATIMEAASLLQY
jgi:hypothetical protein